MSENLTTETQALIDAAFKRYAAQLKKESRRLFGSAQEQYARQEALIESLSPWKRGKIDG